MERAQVEPSVDSAPAAGSFPEDDLRARFAEIASSPEYAPKEPSWMERAKDWLFELLGELLSSLFGSAAAESILPWFVFGLLALAIGALGWRFLRQPRAARRRVLKREEREPGNGERAGNPRGDFLQALEYARVNQLRAAGELLYSATLESLAERDQIQLAKDKTPGDYRRELEPAKRATFGELVRRLDPVLWGGRSATHQQFDDWERLARELGAGK